MNITCPVSLGELVDKLSILKIKKEKIKDAAKLVHIKNEEEHLEKTLSALKLENIQYHLGQMIDINTQLWVVEDDIRDCERNRDFGETFIRLARSVYVLNDDRFKRKNTINSTYNSSIVEVKSYQEY